MDKELEMQFWYEVKTDIDCCKWDVDREEAERKRKGLYYKKLGSYYTLGGTIKWRHYPWILREK